MNKLLAVVAALLLIQPTIKVATAADNSKHFDKYADAPRKQKKVDKILAMLRSLGISDPEITAFAHEINDRRKDGYFMLRQERIETPLSEGNLTFRYVSDGKIGIKRLELNYTPDDSHTEYSLRTNAAMVTYKLRF
jgi:hypothetical protein